MEKYDSLRNIPRNAALVAVRDITGLSFRKLGKKFNISGQAAWAIYKRTKGD